MTAPDASWPKLAPLAPTKRVRLVDPDGRWGGEDALVRKAFAAVALWMMWSGMGLGVEPSPGIGPRDAARVALFKRVCEGRASWKSYSTCADGTGYCAAAVGVRDERWLNRDDDNLDGVPDDKQQTGDDLPPEGTTGAHHWRVSLNITMQVQGGIALGSWVDARALREPSEDGADPGLILHEGDLWLIGENGREHVGIVYSEPVLIAPGVYSLFTVEAGQVDAGGQCVKGYSTLLRNVGGRWSLTRGPNDVGRPLIGWNDCTRLPRADVAIVPEDFLGGEPVADGS